jgi:uncharacterized membrane protein YraQ (UPF0718 family)
MIIIDLFLEGLIALRDYFIFRRIISLTIAFSLSGAIVVFLSQQAIIKYFGPKTHKGIAYIIAAISGAILTVCSCSVLPMFASIRKKGAGLGPAITFLFSGPAINVLAITMTFSLIGFDIGASRIIGAIILSIVIGLMMFLLYNKSEVVEADERLFTVKGPSERALWQNIVFFATLLSVLIFWYIHWIPTVIVTLILVVIVFKFFSFDEIKEWGKETFLLVKKIIPLFIIGIFIAGVIGALLDEEFVVRLVGNNTYQANLLAGTFGAFMYFATLTEVPIVNMFIHTLGMHKGPAVALLLAGPSLSLPNMIVITKVLKLKKAMTYFILVITLSAVVGLIAGFMIGG